MLYACVDKAQKSDQGPRLVIQKHSTNNQYRLRGTNQVILVHLYCSLHADARSLLDKLPSSSD